MLDAQLLIILSLCAVIAYLVNVVYGHHKDIEVIKRAHDNFRGELERLLEAHNELVRSHSDVNDRQGKTAGHLAKVAQHLLNTHNNVLAIAKEVGLDV